MRKFPWINKMNLLLDYLIRWDYISIELGADQLPVRLLTVLASTDSEAGVRTHLLKKNGISPSLTTLERKKMETVTVIKKNPTCAELVKQEWIDRQEDLKDPEYEALGFDYVEPHTWDNQPEGYWRWQFSWGGPSDELRGYVNEHKELHRLEYWYLDWGDGASLLVDQDAAAWTQMQEMIG